MSVDTQKMSLSSKEPLRSKTAAPLEDSGIIGTNLPSQVHFDQRKNHLAPLLLEGESLKSIIENYLHYYASGDSHTARAKRYDLSYFLLFLAKSPDNIDHVRVADWSLQTTKDFIDYRLSLGESPATVARRVATIKHFGRTLAERVAGYINPAREVRSPTLPNTCPHGLSAEEIQFLRMAGEEEVKERKGAFSALRNQFLVELLLSTGLRADEVRSLILAQIDEDFLWLKNVKTKGKKFRNVYLDSHIQQFISPYLVERKKELLMQFPPFQELTQGEWNKFPVFISFYGANATKPLSFGLSPKTIWRIIANIGRRAVRFSPSPLARLHPHQLRHTFAHGLLDSSKDVRLVAQALGHSDVRTTMRYTERTEKQIALAIEEKLSRSR